MQVEAKQDFDLWKLFLHDYGGLSIAFDEARLADALNKRLSMIIPSDKWVSLDPPEYSGHWMITIQENEESKWFATGRFYNKKEVKKLLPRWLVVALNQINRMDFDISEISDG